MVKKVLLTVLLLVFAFYGKVNAQTYTITTNKNASNLTCTTFSGNNVISIGNGSLPYCTLVMNAQLDLTTCGLGPVQIIVRSGSSLDFSAGNNSLRLSEGSSVIIENGGILIGGSCNASERIYIGENLVASCNGGASADVDFTTLSNLGGTGLATSNSPVCVGNAINLTATPPPNGGPYTYSWSGPGLSATPFISSPNYSLIATGGGIYQIKMKSSIIDTRPNPDVPFVMIAETTVVVNPSMTTTPTVASATAQPTCTLSTGTITVSAPTGSGMKYSINGLTYTNTSGVFTSLSPGAYSVTAKNSSGCISNATSVLIKKPTNTWNVISGVGSWSNGTQPVISEDIVFAGNYNSSLNLVGINLSACSCTVNAGVSVNINAGHTLTLTNGLKVDTPGFGDMTFFNNASLVQTNNVLNSGNIDYVRTTNTGIINTDYIYWSSPVKDFTLGGVSRNKTISDKYYSYNPTEIGENWQQESVSTVMSPGKGYIVRGPEPGIGIIPGAPYTATFTGVPNNGDVTLPVPYNSNFSLPSTDPNFGVSYLLGNPYPSALDAETFLKDNAGVLSGTLYFWTHKTKIGIGVSNPGTGVYAYSRDDYATYNATGGVAATQRDIDLATGKPYPDPGGGGYAPSGGAKPNGYISAGQGFFATAKATGTINFTNAMRVASGVAMTDLSGINQQFFKSRNPKTITKNAIEKNRIWLNLTNTQGAFKQTLVGYITDATNGYDDRFDGESFDGNEFVDFYSVNQDKNLTIQGRALPFDENDEVPLGYRTTINGAFTINIDQVDGSLTNKAVFIEDKLTNTIFDLKNGNYTFNTVAGTFNDRFVLKYNNKTLGTTNFDTQANKVLVSNKNKQLKINSFAETIDKVAIYDLSGKQIYQKDKVNSSELSIANLVSSRQTLIVKTVLQNGTTVTDKIIF
ncbi:T9SS sorting signal type C domain-containing protein [Flavobacterium soyangense]|uniref:T9SS sorting signal type C domain-containing protein n=1 Tax=Flavobacterium soyangense TaxID=2023265 RepID=A0A930U7X5_9FLAO|nr:T9SS sorting signal type C domain-containing protein [Flavobacterium soyangense]MBF2707120.1 T9SS sorting signal type C domain-containing protein [Flavobacterium soyangense]